MVELALTEVTGLWGLEALFNMVLRLVTGPLTTSQNSQAAPAAQRERVVQKNSGEPTTQAGFLDR